MRLTLPGVIVLAIGLAATLGLCVGVVRCGPPANDEGRASAEGSTRPKIRRVVAMSVLADDQPLRLRIQESLKEPERGADVSLFYTTSPYYEGDTHGESLRNIIQRGKAEALEYRLGSTHLARLRAHLGPLDLTLRDTSLVIAQVEERVKRRLRTQPDRCILVPALDSRNSNTIDALRRLEAKRRGLRPKEGILWSEPNEGGARHFIVLWEEWPALKSLYDDRFSILRERNQRVRDWISIEFQKTGTRLFSSD